MTITQKRIVVFVLGFMFILCTIVGYAAELGSPDDIEYLFTNLFGANNSGSVDYVKSNFKYWGKTGLGYEGYKGNVKDISVNVLIKEGQVRAISIFLENPEWFSQVSKIVGKRYGNGKYIKQSATREVNAWGGSGHLILVSADNKYNTLFLTLNGNMFLDVR